MPAVHDGGGGPATPGWLKPADPENSHDLFTQAQGMGVRVEPDVLKTFSAQTGAEAAAFNANVASGIGSLMQLASGVGAGTQSSAHLAGTHGDRVQQLMAFAQDVGVGLAAFSAGSSTIALNYVDSDSTQSATMQQVTSAFAPPAGGPSLRQQMDAAAAEQAEVTAEDQAVIDGMVETLELPEPTDLSPDQDAPTDEADPRAGEQTVEYGDTGDTYTVDRNYDLEGLDPNGTLEQMGADAETGDDYTAPQPDDE
ncbi:hypothetical protein [Modestobacter sp. Leaf380]|uniref:hypothetical protein n=1 Tax=Modestobacter sp. Leaf380 TaxID=1736356 RepID=UPI0006FD4510|nr:hypothetical protein [Modestobacter sp. Leaf380]KQS73743.1 hypothetical protein ASG41_03895 [Modestobacter sp. Leaf380]